MNDEQRLRWLRERQKGIGGSDAPHLILSQDTWKYADPEKIWRSKVEPIVTADRPSLAAEVGTELEDFVARKFSEATGLKVRRDRKHFVHPEHPFMVGNIDRKILYQPAGLECKTTSAYRDKLFTGEQFPPEYFVQVQHYLAVTGWDCWYLAALIGNHRFVHYKVERDEVFIRDVLIPTEVRFWEAVVSRENIWEV